ALGLFPVRIALHPEVVVTVTVNVARSPEEAQLQIERGGAIIGIAEPAAEPAPAEVRAGESSAAEAPPS
ncbi:MAG TPA: 50S ribosomal protein L9, partial [Alphaproteobacteria bacterium]|nr:50S ribosomal protein L9 [Alphaproteobacteria bacterium]